MFVAAPEHFHLSEETKELLYKSGGFHPHPRLPVSVSSSNDGECTSPLSPRFSADSLLQHAMECKKQLEAKWNSFKPRPPQVVSRKCYDVIGDCWDEEQVMVELDCEPFGRGALRECFRMNQICVDPRAASCSPHHSQIGSAHSQSPCAGRISDQRTPKSGGDYLAALVSGLVDMNHKRHVTHWVAKRAIDRNEGLETHKQDCLKDIVNQTLAKHCAEEFNAAVQERARVTGLGRCGAHDIDFLMTSLVEFSDGTTYGTESFVYGDYKKHNNNSGATMGSRNTPQAFSYFSFINSNRRYMIVDIQGVDNIYTDPVVHFLPSHFEGTLKEADSPVNLGIRGFALFLWSHRRNPIDELLSLPVFPLSAAELGCVPAMARGQGTTIKELATVSRAKDHRMVKPVRTINEADEDGEKERPLEVSLAAALGPGPWLHAWQDIQREVERGADATPSTPTAAAFFMGGCKPLAGGNGILPLNLVDAACHMEIAAMYNDGRICLGHNGSGPDALDIESAVFHLAQAARQGLAEALLGLARLASELSHDDFLPQVKSTEKDRPLCLALLARAAVDGSVIAHGALANLLLEGGGGGGQTELAAARHLEAFAEMSEMSTEKTQSETVPAHEVSCKYGCTFGWENHGWASHSALARAAQLYDNELKNENGAWDKARALWAQAAEIAFENPLLAKQAMRYSEQAELEREDA